MATGTVKWFAQGLHDLGNKIHDMDGDDWRLGIVTTATVPSVTTAAPHWGGTGTTDFATNQVATGTGYTGPIVLANEAWTLVSGVPTFRADVITIPQDATGFANAAWGIIYNNTDVNKRAIAYVEISSTGTVGIQAGSLVIDWNGATNDILSISQS